MNWPDPMPNEMERERLAQLLGGAIVEMRYLSWQGKAEQVAALADAVHELPREMYNRDGWSVAIARQLLDAYEGQYGNAHGYVTQFDRIFVAPDDPPK